MSRVKFDLCHCFVSLIIWSALWPEKYGKSLSFGFLFGIYSSVRISIFILFSCDIIFIIILLFSVSVFTCSASKCQFVVLSSVSRLKSSFTSCSVYIHFCINYFTYLLFYFETNVCFWPAWVLIPASVFPWFEHCFHLCCYFHRCLVSLLFVTPWSVIDK